MKRTILFFIFLLLISVSSFSQNYIFKMYSFECSELFDITLKKPKGFKVTDGDMTPFRVNEKKTVGMFYRMVLQSKDKDCLVLFPYFSYEPKHPGVTKNMTFAELKACLNLNVDDKTLEIDTAKYIKTFTGENMENYFNADTVFVCRNPLIKPYREVYNYCIGINATKKGHATAMMKIFFSEEGKAKEEEYMQALFNSIRFSDVARVVNTERFEKTRKKLKSKFWLYGKKCKSWY